VGSRSSAKASAQSSAKEKVKGEMVLRPLGRVDPPPPSRAALEGLLGEAPEEPPPPDIPEAWLRPAVDGAPTYANRAPTDKSPEQLRLERLLAGAVFSSPSGSAADAPTASGVPPGAAGEDLENLLRPSVTTAVSAKVLPTQRLLLPKGAFLDCTLETAIDSSLPGMTTCVLATDTFSADGSVVLLERGTKLVGETRGQVRTGSARVFVLWAEARTPTGVVIALASAGSDELGRSGLPGKVNRHFFERFGAAILVSVIDGAVQAAVQSQSEGDDTVVVSPTTSSQVMTEVLKSTISIPPTVVKPQGDRIAVVVARDLDFRSVYELRTVAR
jgi:type IV secretion system protein VirB10